MIMKPTLVVLAAGIGSRYGGLKQIDPIGPCGESIIDYSIYDAARAGFGKVVFVIRHTIEDEFRKSIGDKYKNIIDVDYAFQELDKIPEGYNIDGNRVKPWGTGHAILVAKNVVNTPFAVINSDDFYGKIAFEKICHYLSKSEDSKFYDYSMVGFKLKNTLSEFGYVSRGVCEASDSNYLVDIIERVEIYKKGNAAVYIDDDKQEVNLTGNEIVSMNMWGFTLSIFDELEVMFKNFIDINRKNLKAEFFIPYAVDDLIKSEKAKVKVLETDDLWFGITYKEDKKFVTDKINQLVKDGIYPHKLY
ncbi:MAG: nucleotidyltransferase [bacterium]|nr:nucleotidyltransferase [bacterium]